MNSIKVRDLKVGTVLPVSGLVVVSITPSPKSPRLYVEVSGGGIAHLMPDTEMR